jgi:hypothetical protein
MADKVQIDQAGIATVYVPASSTQLNQTGLTVVYALQPADPKIFIVQGGVTVVYSDQDTEGRSQIDQVGATVVYLDYDPVKKRKFPVPNIKTKWQSQYGKRKFPVVI